MEISDFISGIEQTKILGASAFGFITGGVARVINFDNRIENRKRKNIFSKDVEKEKKYTKLAIAGISGLTSTTYNGPISSDALEVITYSSIFRLGYEVGYNTTKNIEKYIKK